jgi:hypothetical protein
MRGFMDKINDIFQILVNFNILMTILYSIYRRWEFNKKAEAVRTFASFLDQNASDIKLYDKHELAKYNALDKLILSGLSYEDKK